MRIRYSPVGGYDTDRIIALAGMLHEHVLKSKHGVRISIKDTGHDLRVNMLIFTCQAEREN